MTDNQNPEQKTRDTIYALPKRAGKSTRIFSVCQVGVKHHSGCDKFNDAQIAVAL